jgi:AraC-like DNA-binding protein
MTSRLLFLIDGLHMIKDQKKEWKQFARVNHLDNLETLKALFYSHSFGRHYHEGYAIGLILEGSETYQCNKKVNVAPKGSVVVVNPGEVHNGHASDVEQGWGYFMIYPHLSLVKKALEHLGLDRSNLPIFEESVFIDPLFSAHLTGFMNAFETGDSKLALETHFLELLKILIQEHASFKIPGRTIKKDDARVNTVLEMIHSDFDQNLSLEDLAGQVNLSPYALLRLFKKQTGVSPYLLQTGLRIETAKSKLKSGNAFADIAASCGFADQSHMIKQFKKWIGVTPGEYRLSII